MNKIITFKLLFKATRDGDKLDIIHNKCDNKSVLIIIKTKKDIRFGGYSEIGFNDKGAQLNDRNAFVFSLDKKLIYTNNGNPAIYCEKSTFGFKNTIYVYDNFLTNNNSQVIGGCDHYLCKQYELNNGENKFSISEMEVFQIKCD